MNILHSPAKSGVVKRKKRSCNKDLRTIKAEVCALELVSCAAEDIWNFETCVCLLIPVTYFLVRNLDWVFTSFAFVRVEPWCGLRCKSETDPNGCYWKFSLGKNYSTVTLMSWVQFLETT